MTWADLIHDRYKIIRELAIIISSTFRYVSTVGCLFYMFLFHPVFIWTCFSFIQAFVLLQLSYRDRFLDKGFKGTTTSVAKLLLKNLFPSIFPQLQCVNCIRFLVVLCCYTLFLFVIPFLFVMSKQICFYVSFVFFS